MAKVIGFNIDDVIKRVAEKANANKGEKRPKVGEGIYKVKLFKAENTKSQNNKNMSKFTFEVVEGESKSGLFNHYCLHNFNEAPAEGEEWKIIVFALLSKIYGVNVEKFESLAEDYNEFLSLITNNLIKKCEDEPSGFLKVYRKASGQDANGNTMYKNYFSLWEDEVSSEEEETTDENVEEPQEENPRSQNNKKFWDYWNKKLKV
jgi:hypothetical protein